MRKIQRRLARWLEGWRRAATRRTDELPDLSLEDWADLPPHHPACNRAGC
jgi:hypothetical protein